MEISAAHKKKKGGITIVVVGDRGSGKSSLIRTALSGTFPTDVDPVLPPTRLLDDVFPERVPVTLIDTSVEQRDKLEEELRCADAVLLTYACDRLESFKRLSVYWIPYLGELQVKVPVIVVGCKCDVDIGEGGHFYLALYLKEFAKIETCIKCSAYKHIKISEVFYYVTRAALYPRHPLFDEGNQDLRPQFVKALKRIFILCDHDKDDALSDAELNDFQVKCFNAPLELSQILGIKRVVQQKIPGGVNENGLTLSGFLFLHALLVEQLRLDRVWTVLRKFGYNDDIRLEDDLLPSSFKRAADQSVELTNDAVGYLKGIFSKHDYSKDGLLRPSDVECLFSTAPDCPWDEGPYKDAALVTEYLGSSQLTVDGFLSQWVLMTLLEPAKSVEYLKYLLYGKDASSAIRLTRRRRVDRKKRKSERNVYQCFVFGPKKAGKSALLDAFLERPFCDRYHANTEERYAVNVVGGPLGSKKFLVLREIPEDEVEMLLSDKESLAACDLAIFVFDSSDELSWKKTTNLLVEVAGHGENYGDEVPSLIVAAKDDINPYRTEIHASIQVSKDMGIEAPIPVSVKSGDLNDIFRRIVSCAELPHLSIPETGAVRRRKQCHRLVDQPLLRLSVVVNYLSTYTRLRLCTIDLPTVPLRRDNSELLWSLDLM